MLRQKTTYICGFAPKSPNCQGSFQPNHLPEAQLLYCPNHFDYAYHRTSGEIGTYVWGKRNVKTAKKLCDELKSKGINYDVIYTDN